MTQEIAIGELIAEQVARLFSDQVDRQSLLNTETGLAPTALWANIESLGLVSALVPEALGGAGLNWADIEPTLQTIGQHGAPLPLAEGLLAHWLLASAGIEPPAGMIAVCTDIIELDANDCLSGTTNHVCWAPISQYIVALAKRKQQYFVVLIDTSDCELQLQQTIARIPSATLHFRQSPSYQLSAAPATIETLGILPHYAALLSCQIAGALAQLLTLCVDYGNTREQFGRPIGKFQAIQHAIAELAAETAAAQVAGLYHCRLIDQQRAEYGAMIAKTRAGQAASNGARIAHQVFGAIGFTDEHSLHYLTRRLWQWRSDGGSELWWSERLGKRSIAAGGDALWASISR